MEINCEIRPYLARDLDEIRKIERQCFGEFPWDDIDFDRFLGHIGRNNKSLPHSAYVAEWREHIVGYIFLVEYPRFFDIVNLAVSPQFQRKGVGSQLIRFVQQQKLEPYGREELMLYIKQSSEPAIYFAESHGFYKAEKVKGHFDDNTAALKYVYVMPERQIDLTKIPVREGGLMICDEDL